MAIICSLALFWASASAQFFGGVPRLSRSATPLPYGPLPGADLVLVQVAFRHSRRASFLNDPYYLTEATYSGCQLTYPGFNLTLVSEINGGAPPPLSDLNRLPMPSDGLCLEGWLTPKGYLVAQELGQFLRSRYVSDSITPRLLDNAWNPEHVWAHTTTYHRTTNTLRGVISGMFPNEAATSTKLIAHAVNSTYEYMYSTGSYCPPLKPLFKLQENLTVTKLALDKAQRAAAAKVMKVLKLGPVNASMFSTAPGDCGQASAAPCWIPLYDKLASMQANDDPWPSGVTPELFGTISKQAVQALALMEAPPPEDCLLTPSNCTANLAAAGAGSLIWRLVENMIRRRDGVCGVAGFNATNGCPSHPKMVLYAGHDNTSLDLLRALGQPVPSQWPPFANHLEFELWRERDSRKLKVRVLFQGVPLLISGSYVNSFANFKAFLSPYIVTQQQHQDMCWPGTSGK